MKEDGGEMRHKGFPAPRKKCGACTKRHIVVEAIELLARCYHPHVLRGGAISVCQKKQLFSGFIRVNSSLLQLIPEFVLLILVTFRCSFKKLLRIG